MKSFTISFAFLCFITSSHAAPHSAHAKPRQFEAGITFIGAGPDPPSYFQAFPTDDTLHTINNSLSVSQISSAGGAICSFFGVDGSDTFIHGGETVDVGPPQVQVSGVCDEE
ncbi:hypothetical protein HO173_002440 [Letharia columbiana]|uniref:Uncharacterized protein n=1 Tax=Letharia columbiana TaxID=112416 RepID=A0A8H6G2D4_9LECA|nr:uncharacterized protein HO173_002440 [Letharia columbiana]KAF6239179.1 hypothetical protein HO173_002440 [Letharia columbiana]